MKFPRSRSSAALALLAASTLMIAPAACAETWDGSARFYASFVDPVAEAAGIGRLGDRAIPEDEMEIRIWIGFGLVELESLLQLRIRPDGTTIGHAYQHQLAESPDDEAEGVASGPDEVDFDAWLRRYCVESARDLEIEVCRVRFRTEPDWPLVLASLQALDLTSLPDEGDLAAPDNSVKDGVSMLVEVREGSQYRSYAYSNPAFRDDPEGKKAAEILKFVANLIGAEREAAFDAGKQGQD